MSRIVEITHREDFSAAHKLESPELSEQENRELYGPCYVLHGHNYGLEVTVRGPLDPRTGMVMDLNVLMQSMRRELIEVIDHRYLNEDVEFLRGVIPTAENLAVAFWERIVPHVPAGVDLRRVAVIESVANRAEYAGPEVRP